MNIENIEGSNEKQNERNSLKYLSFVWNTDFFVIVVDSNS